MLILMGAIYEGRGLLGGVGGGGGGGGGGAKGCLTLGSVNCITANSWKPLF